MDPTDFYPTEISWQKDSFRSIKPEEFKALGIDPADIPLGTFAARKHPSHLNSRFGGNAYGFGFFETYDRLKPKDLKLFQSITFDNPKDIANHYKDLNETYKNIGLLISIKIMKHINTYFFIRNPSFVTNSLPNRKIVKYEYKLF